MTSVTVESLNRFLSENLDVITDIPKPCINIAINPTYDETKPVCAATNPKCSMAITKNVQKLFYRF